MSNHIPGPWYVGNINTNEEDGVVGEVAIMAKTDRTEHGFCTPAVALPFGDHSPGRAAAMANARLIAASPTMLEALKEVEPILAHKFSAYDPNTPEARALALVRAAIAATEQTS